MNFRENSEDHQFVRKVLGIYRGRTSSGYFDGLSDGPILGSSNEMFLRIFRGFSSGISEERNPRKIPRMESLVFSEEYIFPRYSIRIFRRIDISSEFHRYIPRKPNFVFPRNILGNSSGYSEDFIFRRIVRQNTAVFL
ncbi:hypothetical protein F2Q68_00006489 [Brassica cretica]|uniref:Uncharacterized protein n=1 Tax=Brassica cretica TaxID=69181 RepID=A0A8S9JHJ7_BRACR|nr:hypothetical protein F2Q68_00006489 [Brassica cretica]